MALRRCALSADVSDMSPRHPTVRYWISRGALLAAAGVGYAYASRVANLFGNSTAATVGYVIGAIIVIGAGTWLVRRAKA